MKCTVAFLIFSQVIRWTDGVRAALNEDTFPDWYPSWLNWLCPLHDTESNGEGYTLLTSGLQRWPCVGRGCPLDDTDPQEGTSLFPCLRRGCKDRQAEVKRAAAAIREAAVSLSWRLGAPFCEANTTDGLHMSCENERGYDVDMDPEQKLGWGANGYIRKARFYKNTTAKNEFEEVAVKSFDVSLVHMDRIIAEVDIMGKVSSRYTVGFIHSCIVLYPATSKGTLDLLMPVSRGGDLFDFVATYGTTGEEGARLDRSLWMNAMVPGVFMQLLRATEFLHSGKGVIHRDIKLENVLLKDPWASDSEEWPIVQLSDYGLSRTLLQGKRINARWESCGTVPYMAPELLLGGMYDFRVDIWSLGVSLYVMCAGHLPWEGSEPCTMVSNIKASMSADPAKGVRGYDHGKFHMCPAWARRIVKRIFVHEPYRPKIDLLIDLTLAAIGAEDQRLREKLLASFPGANKK